MRNGILRPGQLYTVGDKLPYGWYLISGKLDECGYAIDCDFNMYPDRPPVPRYRRTRGYWGFTYVDTDIKYIKLENGYALFYGAEPPTPYDLLRQTDILDNAFSKEGVPAMTTPLWTISVHFCNKNQYLYHGEVDVILYEQYVFSIGKRIFWAAKTNTKTHKWYTAVSLGLINNVTGERYCFGDNGCCKLNRVYSKADNPYRLYNFNSKTEFIVLELPVQSAPQSITLEWIQPSCASQKLYRSSKTIEEIYSKEYADMKAILQQYVDIGLNLDLENELSKFSDTPDLLWPSLALLEKCMRKRPIYESKTGDPNAEFTFVVSATYDKRYYCIAKLADKAFDIQASDDHSVFFVSFCGTQIDELSLMYALTCDHIYDPNNPNPNDGLFEVLMSYLYENDFLRYLSKEANQFVAELTQENGYSQYYTHSVFISIRKAIGEIISQRIDSLYSEMAKDRRLTTRWSSEYTLFSIISKYVTDAIYQYRADWLGLQSFDIFIPSQNIAIEYQGKQHYEAVELFGGQEALSDNQERDLRKRMLSQEHGVCVLDWKYNVRVNSKNVLAFMNKYGIDYKLPDVQPIADSPLLYGSQMAPVLPEPEKKKPKKSTKRESPFVIRQYSPEGKFLLEYSSVADASTQSGVSAKSINNAIYNLRPLGGGYIWKRCQRDSAVEDVAPVQRKENTGLARKVCQYSADGDFIAEYKSMSEAARHVGVSSRSISDALSGAQKTAGGYVWKYAEG